MSNRIVIAEKIMEYLGRHPQKEDTLEGIMNWWLRSDKGAKGADEVRDVLNYLLGKGELEEIKDRKEVLIYRVKKQVKVD